MPQPWIVEIFEPAGSRPWSLYLRMLNENGGLYFHSRADLDALISSLQAAGDACWPPTSAEIIRQARGPVPDAEAS